MKADDAKRVIEALQKEVETLQQEKTAAKTTIKSLNTELSSQSEKYKKWVNHAEENFAKVKSANSSLRENNARLEQARKNTDGDKARLSSQFNDVSQQLAKERQEYRQKIAQLYSQNKTLHDKTDTLRKMLVPVSEKQVLDADVVQRFTILRSGIVGLVRQTWVPALKHDVDSLGFSLLQQDLIATELPLTYDRLRCIVFFFIHASVFDSQNYFLGYNFENLEQLVRRVERELNKNSPEGRPRTCSRIILSPCADLLTHGQRTTSLSRSGAMPLSRSPRSSETTDIACPQLRRTKSGSSSAHSRPGAQMRDTRARRN